MALNLTGTQTETGVQNSTAININIKPVVAYVKKDQNRSKDVEILNIEEVEMNVPERFTYTIPLDAFRGSNTTVFAEINGEII